MAVEQKVFVSKEQPPREGTYKGKVLGVFTSGGDSQGMNAAVRAVVRMAVYLGCQPFLIHEGYQGMVEGGKNIVKANWISVSSIIHRGGTIIGSARCAEFRTRPGRLKAARNLALNGINNLIAIGGDGSLTGANLLRQEWSGLLAELLSNGEITEQQKRACEGLNIVGMVGTIDNDFCGTELTIGADSALHRILEVLDSVVSTAHSHQRAFVIEVMGARCGFLAMSTAIAVEADYVFIPEDPPADDWPDRLCKKLAQHRKSGQRLNIIILAEGALDRNGNAITSSDVKKVVADRLNYDTRVNVLGHMQRGGNPSAIDRIVASRMGAEAVIALAESTSSSIPLVIGIRGNKIVRLPMVESVQVTMSLRDATLAKQWDVITKMRGPHFVVSWNICQKVMRLMDDATHDPNAGKRIAVIHIGVPACGMNAAVYAFVVNCINEGFVPLGIHDGMEGLLNGNITELKLSDVFGWVAEGGANLCTRDNLAADNCELIAMRLRQFNVSALLLIGSFSAYTTCLEFIRARETYPEFCIPLCLVPATIDNNVPGTDICIGCDTSLNEITEICDRIRQSAHGTNHRVFIIETMGDYCGYLATMSAVAGGADTAYIFEEQFSAASILNDTHHMISKMNEGVKRGLILCNERASENYNTEFIHRLYKEEGKHSFSCRMNVLGHMQQGGNPTPNDRILGVQMGTKSVEWFARQFHLNSFRDKHSACVLGLVQSEFKYTPIEDLIPECDFEHRIPKHQWWLSLRPLMNVLAKHVTAYRKPETPSTDNQLFQQCDRKNGKSFSTTIELQVTVG